MTVVFFIKHILALVLDDSDLPGKSWYNTDKKVVHNNQVNSLLKAA